MSELIKPRVLFIMHVPPPIHGAAVVGNYIKTSTLINKEINATYINPGTSVRINEPGKGSIKKILTFFRIVNEIIKTLNKKKFDICYFTLTSGVPGFYKDLGIVFILKLYRKKIIYHLHNTGVAKAGKTWINRLLYRFAFTNTRCILLSPNLYPDIRYFVKEQNVFYCPNGIGDNPGQGKKKLISGKFKNCTILFLSNMMIEKGVYILLDALKNLRIKGISFECHFVGAWAGITEEAFRLKVNEMGLDNFVFFHGAKYGNEKHVFFNDADIFLLPTLNEAFPLVILEAMQYGLPVISTMEGGISDMIVEGQTGYIVPKGSMEALSDKLEILINDPQARLRMGNAAKDRFNLLFTLDKFENNIVEILKEVIH